MQEGAGRWGRVAGLPRRKTLRLGPKVDPVFPQRSVLESPKRTTRTVTGVAQSLREKSEFGLMPLPSARTS